MRGLPRQSEERNSSSKTSPCSDLNSCHAMSRPKSIQRPRETVCPSLRHCEYPRLSGGRLASPTLFFSLFSSNTGARVCPWGLSDFLAFSPFSLGGDVSFCASREDKVCRFRVLFLFLNGVFLFFQVCFVDQGFCGRFSFAPHRLRDLSQVSGFFLNLHRTRTFVFFSVSVFVSPLIRSLTLFSPPLLCRDILTDIHVDVYAVL